MEAKRIASELKTIAGREEEVKGQISDTESKLSGLNKELTQHSEELEVIKNKTDAQEKQEGNTVQCTSFTIHTREQSIIQMRLISIHYLAT